MRIAICHVGGGHCGDPVCAVEYATSLEWITIDADTQRLKQVEIIEAAEALLDA